LPVSPVRSTTTRPAIIRCIASSGVGAICRYTRRVPPVHAAAPDDDADRLVRHRRHRRHVNRTGGEKLKVENAGDGVREVVRRLRRRYTLQYERPMTRAGEKRDVKVALTSEAARRYRGARITARTGYIAPGAIPPS
jgi:hypothetical protein